MATITQALLRSDLREIIQSSDSVSAILEKLGIEKTNYSARQKLKQYARSNQIDLPTYQNHYEDLKTGLETAKQKLDPAKETNILELYFFNGSGYRTEKLKELIIKHSLKEYKCETASCGITGLWNGKLLNLHLDHIDGDNKNNSLENLRFLCPNCHSQTDTYKGRNSNSYKLAKTTICFRCKEPSKSGTFCRACKPFISGNNIVHSIQEVISVSSLPLEEALAKLSLEKENLKATRLYRISQNKFCECGNSKNRKAKKCSDCYDKTRVTKTTYPETDVLLERVRSEGYEVLARELGVSGNAIRKRLQRLTGSYPKTQARLHKSA